MNQSTFKQLKASARKSLIGHYGIVIAALLVTQLLLFLIDIPFNRMIREGAEYLIFPRILLGGAGTFFVSLLSVLLSAGLVRIHLMIARGQTPGFSEILYPFRNRPDRYIWFGICIFAVLFIAVLPGSAVLGISSAQSGTASSGFSMLTVVGILLLIAGIIIALIVMLGWALTVFLLLDDNNLSLKEAIRRSRHSMKNSKWRLFKLYLSFIGWYLLSALSLFIGLLWIIPYISQTMVWFYMDLVPENAEQSVSGS